MQFEALNKNSPLPIYYQIKQMILKCIQEKKLQPGDLVPGESEFCQYYGISRPTVRQAMSELVSEGYLVRKKGKGTFVSEPKIDGRFLNKLQSFSDEMKQRGITPSTKLLQFSHGYEFREINKYLGLAENEELFFLERVRFADGQPVVYVRTFFQYERFQPLISVNFEEESFYEALHTYCDTDVVRAKREIEAVNASEKEASLLGYKTGSAICLVKSTAYDHSGSAVEYSIASYRGDRTKFSIELCR